MAGSRQALVAQGSGLYLEVVEPVRVPTPEQLDEAGGRVGQEEHGAPTFVLPDVRLLVSPQLTQRVRATAQHDMAQRDSTQIESVASRTWQDHLQHA